MAKLFRNPDFRLRRGISIDDEIVICNRYLNGESTVKIGQDYKVGHKTIAAILEAYSINRTHNGVRKYMINEKYFDVIDTPNKAYILGLLYADGYNNPDKSTVCLSLRYDDKYILERINEEIGSNKPLKYIKCDDHFASNGYISKDMYKIEVYSSHMCKVLLERGMIKGKSLLLKYPLFITENLHNHFIRGYFDGDGSVYTYENKRKYKQPIITFTSTADFCESVLAILREKTGIGGGIYDASCHNNITKVLSICGKNQCIAVLDWLYKDADLFLPRKYDRYQSILSAA